MSTLKVGASGTYKTLADAVAAARDGDVLKVQAGTYTNDFVTVTKDITIKGVGGMVHLAATTAPPDGKAILTVNSDLTIKHVEFSGAQVPDGNGAGIRYQGGTLKVVDGYFHDNQDGILANAVPDGRIKILDSEFDHNGSDTGLAHNIYIGQIASLAIKDSWFHDSILGHQIKSRALETTITGSRITDDGGTGSFSIDLPQGGKAVITDNFIEQGANSQNPAIIHFGGEGAPYAESSLTVAGNTVVNDLSSGGSLVANQTSTVVEIRDNDVFGLTMAQIAYGAATVSGTTMLASRPAIDQSHPFDDAASLSGSTTDALLATAGDTGATGPEQPATVASADAEGALAWAHVMASQHLDPWA